MKKAFSIFFLIVFIAGLLFPLVSLAGEYKTDTGRTVTYDGLVPCGKIVKINGTDTNVPCQFCHFFVMGKGILDFVLELIIIIAVAMFVYGGFLYLTGGQNPGQIQTAQKVLTSTVIGLVIIFAAWVIINTIFAFLGLSTFGLSLTGPGKWFQIACDITI